MGILALLGGAAALLVQAARRTQRLADQQIEFVAGVTHEILTPLAAIRSAGQNLADGVVAEQAQVRRYGNLIDREGRRLSNMVSQVLAFAGMRARGHSLQLAPVSLAEVIHTALERSSDSLQEAAIEVELDLEENLPAIQADADALCRALVNLISNAVKYAASGTWLGISLNDGGAGTLRLTIEDRGPGIDSRDLPHIFEPFYRGRKISASPIPGSGLGLSLVWNTLEEHGGSIEIEAMEQAGCRFVIQLPTMQQKEQGVSEG
jgi:signal transduction histidine kinase